MTEVSVSTSSLPWYAIWVKSNQERVVSMSLRARGYEEFLPLYGTRRNWSDRQKTINLPLFPGYVFCRFEVGQWHPVVGTPGVVSIVGLGRTPEPVPEVEIQAIRRVITSGLSIVPYPFVRVGERVLIEKGPLAGVEGSLIRIKNALRLVVSVELLQRSVLAEVDMHWVRRL